MALRGFSVRGAVTCCGVLVGLVNQACNLGEGYADFGNDLARPEEVVIDGPGQKIADVRLSGMLVDPWGDDGAVVVGFQYLKDGPHLYLQPFDGSKGCDAGPAYRCIVFNRLEGQPQLIAFLSSITDGQRGTLNFVDHHCKIAYGGIENAELPSRLFEFPPGVVVSAGTELLDIDPYNKTKRALTKNLRFWSGPGEPNQAIPHYYIGDGQLVVFDDERQELIRRGKDVTEVVFESTNTEAGVFLVDEGNLVRYTSSDDVPPEVIDEDACVASLSSYGLSYFSPCGSRQLVLRDIATSSKAVIDVGVGRVVFAEKHPLTDGTGVDFLVMYTKASASDSTKEDLWLKEPGKETRLWRANLAQFLKATNAPTLTAVVDSDGFLGKLVQIDASGETTLMSNVVLSYGIEPRGSSWLLMSRWDTDHGRLLLVDSEGKSKIIADGVPLNSKILSPEIDPYLDGVEDDNYYTLAAFVSEVEKGLGKLGVMTRSKPLTLEPIASGVRPGNFEFFRNMAALGYLDRFDEGLGSGRLAVYQTTLEATSVVAEDVEEFTELLWPYEGVIYTAKRDDKHSLWAARAK